MKRLLVLLSLIFSTVSYADTETINWYVDGSVYNTTSCQSGENVTLPTQPSKTGYTFVGWEIALYDFSTLDASINAKGFTKGKLTWNATFDYGNVSGVGLCSTSYGVRPAVGTPDESGTGATRYCWCKATGYKPSGSNIVYENSSSSPWVFSFDCGTASDCATSCGYYCGTFTKDAANFRRALFVVTQ